MKINKKTIAISGFFQIVHAGHIDCIEAAKKYGDIVIAIVNSDKQARLKSTPSIVPEEQRLKVIQNIKGVDIAILSIDEDESVAQTLEMFTPDIFMNSGDRNETNCNPKEKEVCDRLGIEIVYDDSPKVQSSSWIMEKIKNS